MFFNQGRGQMRVAVISAHPDDETFGAGGTLARHAAMGDEVCACIVTKAYTPDWPETTIQLQQNQTMQALEVLGIENIRFLEFPTVKLNVVPGKELNDKIRGFINEVKPQVVYVPFSGDLNSDHQIVARSVSIAVRPTPENKMTLLFFEILSSTEWGRMFLQTNFRPNVYVNIASTIKQKIEAARCYQLEIREFPHPRSVEGIEALARIRGMEAGIEAAEAFMLAFNVS